MVRKNFVYGFFFMSHRIDTIAIVLQKIFYLVAGILLLFDYQDPYGARNLRRHCLRPDSCTRISPLNSEFSAPDHIFPRLGHRSPGVMPARLDAWQVTAYALTGARAQLRLFSSLPGREIFSVSAGAKDS